MRFGVYLPTFWDDYGTSSMPAAIVQAAQAAEALGFDSGWANDKIVNGHTIDVVQVIEPLITLGTLVHLTPGIRLGTGVIVVPQRDPILLAKQAAALDILSGHRIILGVGIGHAQEEFELLGADFTHRASVTDEGIDIMRALWREATVTHKGRHHHLQAMRMPPHPPTAGRLSGSAETPWRQSVERPDTVMAGFRSCGIWRPFAPEWCCSGSLRVRGYAQRLPTCFISGSRSRMSRPGCDRPRHGCQGVMQAARTAS